MAIVGKDVCKLFLRICRKGALSSTIKILSLFISLGLEFEEAVFPIILQIFVQEILEVNRVNYVFRDKNDVISGHLLVIV
jgi:hypothetical protein